MTDTLTYDEYLATLPADRRDAVSRVWQVVRDHIPTGYEEQIGPKFLQFATGPDGYVALANQKNYVSLYLLPAYVDPSLKHKLDSVDKKLKMGKSCLNFNRADELPLDVIGEIVAAFSPAEFQERLARNRTAHRA
ncbi:MAG TPA: DUF1801 domain-containing protein [bacterium]|nr:DUF1801 domain-containing protein [bacterium]